MADQWQCCTCHHWFDRTPDNFHKDRGKPDGLSNRCKICARQKSIEWTAANAERKKLDDQQYYQMHKEQIKRRVIQWQDQHAAQVTHYKRKSDKSHRAQKNANWHAYMARKINSGGSHSAADIQRQYNAQKGKCYYCGEDVGDTYHVDHVIPLSRGGSNSPDNLVVSCPSCNTSKGSKLPHEWTKGGKLL